MKYGSRIGAAALVSALIFGLQGCAAPIIAVGAATLGVAATQLYNLARDQYPDINFEAPAPVEVTYAGSYESVWNALVDTLGEMHEQMAVVDKQSGLIRTVKNNLNEESWIGKGLGKSTFKYEFNLTVRKNEKGIGVRSLVPFWEEKVFIAEKQKNLPEGTNMMRHILYRNLAQKAKPLVAKMPDKPDTDVRYAPSENQAAPSAQKRP
ncbi:MAG TPA: hypothetical protein PLJ64_12380 [Solirubrobacterales bacterium]|nr:hypothetical protein [Solirubrobacterales bacterium]